MTWLRHFVHFLTSSVYVQLRHKGIVAILPADKQDQAGR